jgi:hypothetical protein
MRSMNTHKVGSFGALIRLLVHLLAFEAFTLAYFGPDTIMPLGSALAAGIGIFLMFWQRGVRFVKSTLRRFAGSHAQSQGDRD